MGANKVRQVTADPDFATLPKEVQDQLLIEADAAADDAAPAAAAPAAPEKQSTLPPSMEYINRASGPFVKAAGGALVDMVNPMSYVRSAGGLLKLAARAAKAGTNPVSLAAEFGPDTVAAAEALKEQVSTPEGVGEALGSVAPAAIPLGGLLGRIGRYGRETKAANVIKAVSETNPAKKQVLEKLVNSGDLELPVSSSAKSLRAKMAEKVAEAGPELEAAKADLQGLPEVSVKQAVKDLVEQRPVVEGAKTTTTVQPKTPAGLTSEKPAPVTVTTTAEGSGNPALLSAVDSQIDELLKVAGAGKAMKPEAIQAFKEQAQAAATSAYKVAHGTGAATAPGAEASEMVAKALRETLETSPEIPADIRGRLTAANKEMSKLMAVTKPMEARRLADIDKPFISRSIAGLLGRGVSGGGTSALGAAAGVEAGSQFQNVLFNTLSAAGKAKIAPLLEAGDFQAAIQAAFAEHIAENAARRQGAVAQ